MLVLSRRPHDAIMIGHDIVVTVLSVTRDHVRIGIQAPPDVEVHREEVYLAIQEQNRRSASPTEGDLEGLATMLPGRSHGAADQATPTDAANADTTPTGTASPGASPSEKTTQAKTS